MKKILSKEVSGQELVEYAIIIPVFIVLIMGIIDMGRAVFYYSLIYNAAREGARYGVVHPDDEPYVIISGVESAAKRITAGLDDSKMTISTDLSYTNHINVCIEYTFTAVTPIVATFMGDQNVLLESCSIMRMEY